MDSAAARHQREFETCTYTYSTEERVRECLVMRHGWPIEDAARAIAIFRAGIRKEQDSLDRIRNAQLEREEAERRVAARQAAIARAAQERRDSIRDAGREFWGSRTLKLFFRNTMPCVEAHFVRGSDRVSFTSGEEAEAAGYRRTDKAGC